jgi:hypothetical protein
MDDMLKESILQELINKVQWPITIGTTDVINPIVHRGLDLLKGAGIGVSSFEDGKIPTIGDIIGIAGKLSGEVGKIGSTEGNRFELKGADKLQTVLGVVDVLLSYLEAAKPAWAGELGRLKVVARDVLPASLSFAVSVAKGELDLGTVLRKPEGVAHLEHGRSLFRRFLGLLRRLTPALALCGASSAVAAAVDQIEDAPRAAMRKIASSVPIPASVLEQVGQTVGIPFLDIQSEKEPVAPPSTPRPSLEEPLEKVEAPQPTLEPVAEEVRSSSPVEPASDQAPNSPSVDSRRILHDA